MEAAIETKIENKEAKPNPQALSGLAEKARTTDQATSFMEPGTKVKGKRGRPSKEELAKKAQDQKAQAINPQNPQSSPQPAPAIPSALIAKPVAGFISNMGVSYVGDPRAGMTPDELENMASALGLVMDKYMGTIMSQYGAEAMLCICLGQYGLRIVAMKKYLEAEKNKAKDKMTEPPKMTQDKAPTPESKLETFQPSTMPQEIVTQ